ncbi:MAG: hypothetical protein ACYCQJ_11000 [Nitrososphaerales archaeon]
MKISFGAGVIVAILAPLVIYFLGLESIFYALFEVLLLAGLWLLISSYNIPKDDRMMYVVVGLIIAPMSLVFVVPITYAIAAILIMVIIAVVVVSSSKKQTV